MMKNNDDKYQKIHYPTTFKNGDTKKKDSDLRQKLENWEKMNEYS